jgi:hypothetical protein
MVEAWALVARGAAMAAAAFRTSEDEAKTEEGAFRLLKG